MAAELEQRMKFQKSLQLFWTSLFNVQTFDVFCKENARVCVRESVCKCVCVCVCVSGVCVCVF